MAILPIKATTCLIIYSISHAINGQHFYFKNSKSISMRTIFGWMDSILNWTPIGEIERYGCIKLNINCVTYFLDTIDIILGPFNFWHPILPVQIDMENPRSRDIQEKLGGCSIHKKIGLLLNKLYWFFSIKSCCSFLIPWTLTKILQGLERHMLITLTIWRLLWVFCMQVVWLC